ncbi:helix-turn-helix domain-containing protein [Desulfovibrio sp. ZJ369]|uniref:helix-turn-helix domain-containing protein n=1 Tax=Desulfovibrio sp. ZJ369 TaxID=2709793 RepID=UPI0013ECDEE1|nr:helix-turn-helix domain-containing protein [Desulfovibrio sp. ZJ369]
MNNYTLRDDIRACLKGRGISIHRLAQESGVDAEALWRFVNNKKPNLTTDSLFRIWPHVYGEQKPSPLSPNKVEAESSLQEKPTAVDEGKES